GGTGGLLGQTGRRLTCAPVHGSGSAARRGLFAAKPAIVLNYFLTHVNRSRGIRNDKESSAMNAFLLSLKRDNSFSGALLLAPRRTILLPALLLVFVCHPIAVGQSDDFNDGDDNGWVRYNPFGTATFSFITNDNFGGKAYRIQSAASPNASSGPGRALGYRTNVYDDFYAVVDLVSWNDMLN